MREALIIFMREKLAGPQRIVYGAIRFLVLAQIIHLPLPGLSTTTALFCCSAVPRLSLLLVVLLAILLDRRRHQLRHAQVVAGRTSLPVAFLTKNNSEEDKDNRSGDVARCSGECKLKNTIDADFSGVAAGGFLEKVVTAQRRKMFEAFMMFSESTADDRILDVGIKNPGQAAGETLTQWINIDQRSSITPCAIVVPKDRAWHHVPALGSKVLPCDGRHLPFADAAFDWAFCHETIAHLGSFERQYDLLKELCRVSRKGVFVTAANRWHPIEFNTGLPLVHWLPSSGWRRALKWSGKSSTLPTGQTLELLDAVALKKMAALLPGKLKYDVGHLRFLGFKGHLSLQVTKNRLFAGGSRS